MTLTWLHVCLVCILLVQTAAARSLLSRDKVDTYEWALPVHRRHLVLDGSKLHHGNHAEADLQLMTSVPADLGMSVMHVFTSLNNL